nr:MAG TPA: Protein involved in formate dehydrogenase formation [Caudoviricetes sp.]
MELKECITCGSHSFTGNKCDYCGNEYEVQDLYADDKHDMRVYSADGINNYAERKVFYNNDFLTTPEQEEETPEFIEAFELANEHDVFMLKFLASILGLIIWFAVCVFIPPLFLISICAGIIWVCRKVCKKY